MFPFNVLNSQSSLPFDKSYEQVQALINTWQLKEANNKLDSLEVLGNYSLDESAKLKFLRAQIYIGFDYNHLGQRLSKELLPYFKFAYGEESEWYLKLKAYQSVNGFLGGSQIGIDSLEYFFNVYNQKFPNEEFQNMKFRVNVYSEEAKMQTSRRDSFGRIIHSKIHQLKTPHLEIEFYIHLADGFKRSGDFDQSFYWLRKALGLLSDLKIENTHLNVVVYRNLSGCFHNIGNYHKALYYAQLELAAAKQACFDLETDPWIGNALANLGTEYKNLKDYKSALEVFLEMDTHLKKYYKFQYQESTSSENAIGHLAMHEIARLYLELGDYEEAKRRIQKVIKHLNNQWPLSSPNVGESRKIKCKQYNAYYGSTLARIYLAEAQPQKAIDYLAPKIQVIADENIWDSRYIYTSLNVLAEAYYEVGNYKKVLSLVNKNIELSQSPNGYFQYSNFFNALIIKTKSYIALNDDAGVLAISNEVKEILINVIYELDEFESKIDFLKFSNKWFDLTLDYYTKNIEHESNFEELCNLVEYQKGVSLFHKAIQNQELSRSNDAESDTLNSIDNKIFDLEKKLYEGKLNNKSIEKLTERIQNLKDKRASDNLIHFKKQRIKFIPLALEDVRNSLSPNELHVSFFKADGKYYAICISEHYENLSPLIDVNLLDQKIDTFRTSIYDYYLTCIQNRGSLQNEFAAFKSIACDLHSILMEPLNIPSEIEIISFSPIDKINYIPFDALISESKNQETNYLCKSFAINYQPSLSLIQNQSRENKGNNNIYFYAPEFEAQNDTFCVSERYRMEYLGPLKYNKIEVERANKLIGGEVLNGGKKEFLQKCGESKLIHLATHGKVNFTNDDFSFLAFRDQSNALPDEKLYLKELLFNAFDVDCVVLSACESGLGNSYIGEGIKSMASSFMLAGAKSVVSTQWTVNDRSTSIIMQSFYEHLKAGERKDVALQNAKLDYLSKVDPEYQHPFYWAGFTAIGNMETMTFDTSFWLTYKWHLLSIAFFGGILLLVLSKFKSKK